MICWIIAQELVLSGQMTLFQNLLLFQFWISLLSLLDFCVEHMNWANYDAVHCLLSFVFCSLLFLLLFSCHAHHVPHIHLVNNINKLKGLYDSTTKNESIKNKLKTEDLKAVSSFTLCFWCDPAGYYTLYLRPSGKRMSKVNYCSTYLLWSGLVITMVTWWPLMVKNTGYMDTIWPDSSIWSNRFFTLWQFLTTVI